MLILLDVYSCLEVKNPYTIPTFSESSIFNCIIDIPAGINKKIVYNPNLKTFEIDQRDGKDRIIDFFLYPEIMVLYSLLRQ